MSTADTAVRTLEELTAEDRKLIDLIRQMGYGEIYLQIQDGKAKSVRELRQSILLEG